MCCTFLEDDGRAGLQLGEFRDWLRPEEHALRSSGRQVLQPLLIEE